MKKLWILSSLLCLFPFKAQGYISILPWTKELYEFYLQGLWQWSDYSNVANSTTDFSSTDQCVQLDFAVSPVENWEAALEFELLKTTRREWTAESYAVGIKNQIYNDLIGDPFAFSVLGKIRYVPSQSLDQVSSPYSAPMNYSLGGSIGKEWSKEGYWKVRIVAYVELGCGSQGAPWNYDQAYLSTLIGRTHELTGTIDAYLGFGGKDHVDPYHFFGWGKYNHRSSDLKITYTKHLQLFGKWGIAYTQRLYAFCYPDHFRAIEAFYQLPFSLF